MKDGNGAEQSAVSRHQLYEEYVSWCLQVCTCPQPYRDGPLLEKAARYLVKTPRPFIVLPFYQAVMEGARCFTGPFVYSLMPVLSCSTLEAILACIGYLPHADNPLSEYRLCVNVDSDRAIEVGFELLLARVKCLHLLELLEQNQLGPKECLELLQRGVEPMKPEELSEIKAVVHEKENEKKEEEAIENKVPLSMDARPTVKPWPKPQRRVHQLSFEDQSFIEMQMTYPDLAIRGRPLLRDKPPCEKSCSKPVHPASNSYTKDVSDAAQPRERPYSSRTNIAVTTGIPENDSSKVCELINYKSRNSDGNTGMIVSTLPGKNINSSVNNSDGGRADDELSGAQDSSLDPTLVFDKEQSLKPVKSQHTTDSSNRRLTKCTIDKEYGLRELADTIEQFHDQDTKEEFKKEKDNREEKRETRQRGSLEEEGGSTGNRTEETGGQENLDQSFIILEQEIDHV
ncbi:uncharacterized protein ACBR49_009359 [Aulostomus maculatus]